MSQALTGVFITLAWPDCFARSYGGYLDKVMSLLGGGSQSRFRVGHAALVLLERKTGEVEYFDFGRYMSPEGKARVRGKNTDPEVAMPLKAIFDASGQLSNLEDILIWLEAHPGITHGEGRMLAAVCYETNYAKAKNYITNLQNRGSVNYGPYAMSGSNCSRFVRDAFVAGAYNARLRLRNQFPITFLTPSPMGNVVNSTSDGKMWKVYNGKIQAYSGGRRETIRELLTNNFGKNKEAGVVNLIGNIKEPQKPVQVPVAAQWLSGIGAGAWFYLEQTDKPNEFRGQRFDVCGTMRYNHIFRLTSGQLDLARPYQLVYDCHAVRKTVLQNEELVELIKCINSIPQ